MTVIVALLPIAIILYVVSISAQPRRRSKSYMIFLRVHFTSFCWLSFSALATFLPSFIPMLLLLTAGLTLLFHYGLKLRASIDRLPDKDLSEFLVETLFKGSVKASATVLFILFRSAKCMIENNLEQCSTNTRCASFVSIFLLFQWYVKLVHGSIRQEWRKEISLSPEKIAKLDISWRRTAEGIMLAVMGGCGAFLFTLMSAKDPDENLVMAIGLTGCVAGTVCLVSELITIIREQKKRRTQSQLTQPVLASVEELIDGCSWWYVFASFLLTSSYTLLQVLFAITLKKWTIIVDDLIISLVGICMVLTVTLRPKDDGAGIMILHIQSFLLSVGSEAGAAIGHFRGGVNGKGWSALLRMVIFWPIAYQLALKLRKKTAQQPPAKLSQYLCNTLLLGGLGAMAPIIFFSFETLSCFASDGLESDQCENTSGAAMYLSVYLAAITAMSICSKAVSKEDRGEGLTYKNLAILRLKKMQKVQGALGVVTALTSMYLFSFLGVRGDPNDRIGIFGAAGAATLIIALLIEVYILVFGGLRGVEQPAGTSKAAKMSLSGARGFRSSRSISLSRITDDMAIAGVV